MKRQSQPRLKSDPPINQAERDLIRSLQRVADLEFALAETQAALRKVVAHTDRNTLDTAAAYALGQCRAYAEEGLLRADTALGTQPARRRAGDKPHFLSSSCPLTFGIGDDGHACAMVDSASIRVGDEARQRRHA